ncbi:MAG: aminoacyl-tRNA hydrolase [Candidatus Omnitrophota bacterium]|nr:aminoacyl-tRNA hydrolase [Candidatus Omnitrophota bacterium]
MFLKGSSGKIKTREVISSAVKLIVGLGNPGGKYKNSRHNFGFKVVEALAEELKCSFKKRLSLESFMAEADIGGISVLLALPFTFMNLSGRAVEAIITRRKIAIFDLIVVCDDVNLEFSVIRLRPKGSSGGHNGLANIIDRLGSSEFARLRMGIRGGSLGELDLSGYVLSDFNKKEKILLEDIIGEAVGCLKMWVEEGITGAMNKFSQRSD